MTLQDPNTIVSIGEFGYPGTYMNISTSGFPTSVTTSTLTDTNSSWTTNSYQNFVVRCAEQNKMIESNSSNILYLKTAWDDIPATSSQYLVINSYKTDQTDLEITEIIDSIGRGKWANIKFENVGGQDSYDEPDSSFDTDLWDYTNSGTSGRVTSSILTESDNYIIGEFMINTGSATASFNIGISTSSLPALAEMAQLDWRIQRGAQIPADDSDGALIFETDSKSYGNLIEGTDYNVSGNTLYLFVDRKYNFSSMNVGAGTTVRLDSSITQGSVLWISCTGSATIAGTFRLDGTYNPWTYGNQVKTTWNGIAGPGVRNGGAGGKGGDAPNYGIGGAGGAQSNGFGGGAGGGAVDITRTGQDWEPGGAGGAGGLSPSGGDGATPSSDDVDPGSPGSQSGGGGGAAGQDEESGGTGDVWGGDGGSYHGDNADNGYRGDSAFEDAGGAGGGGAGGRAGKQGCHFYLYTNTITFPGTINTSGYAGTSAGAGGDGDEQGTNDCGGGGGGGGAGGGSAGNIKMFYVISFDDSGSTKTMSGGSAGSGGAKGYGDGDGEDGVVGSGGYSGYSGSFTSEQQSVGFQSTDGKMYVFGETYNILDDDSEWKLIKLPNDDWALYDDLVLEDIFSAANNVIGVQMNGTYTNSTALTYNWKLYDLTIGGRARMRIEANAYIQTFIQST